MSVESRITQEPGLSGAGVLAAARESFLGHAPDWYKATIVGFLLMNPLVLLSHGAFVVGWLMLFQFIFMLALALRCYPLAPGGLLAIEALLMGLASPEAVYAEVEHGLPVLMLVIFMVASVHFLKDFLFMVLTKVLIGIEDRIARAFMVCASVSLLSAFLDALTVLAVLITVGIGFHDAFQRATARLGEGADLDGFRAFMRGMMMHAAVGTAIGGVCTLVGEPENIIIGSVAGWNFGEFFWKVAPISLPTLVAGLLTCLAVEKLRWFGYGAELTPAARDVLRQHDEALRAQWAARDRFRVMAQGAATVLLVLALAFHIAEVGLIGLALLAIGTAINGVTDEHRLAKAFEHGMPFAALLVVFFAIVAVIHEQHLFEPVIGAVLQLEGNLQLMMIYVSNGVLSAVSDNVFVATIYVSQSHQLLEAGLITREVFDAQAVAITMGTGIPAMATPNGQAAFLFLLTSALAAQIRLSYGRMVWMALPYTIATSLAALGSIAYFL